MTRSKYNAVRTTLDGYTFDSRAEAEYYQRLRLLERAGEISALEVHPVYVIFDGVDAKGKRQVIRYEGDFGYTENGRRVVCDVKGVRTDVYKLKRKMFECRYHDIDFVEVTK